MYPNISPPTDNIYKFSCLFGLALVVTAVFSFASIYSSSLERKVKYAEIVMLLEATEARSKKDDSVLEMNQKLIELTRQNENAANSAIAIVLAVGLFFSAYGAYNWFVKIQARDDSNATLMNEKLSCEIAKLNLENDLLKSKINPNLQAESPLK